MGRAKSKMIEWEAEGSMHPFKGDKRVCSIHFKDKYLQDYIMVNGHIGKCSYCGELSIPVLDMSSFMEYIEDKLRRRLCLLEDANLPSAGSYFDDEDDEMPGFCRAGIYVIPKSAEKYEDVQELMDSYDLCTLDDDLNRDIASCFNDGEWTQIDVFAEDIDEKLSYAWENFSEMVKYKKRYTFFQDPHFLRQEEWKDDVLTEINQICGSILASKLCKGTLVFRKRPNDTGIPRTSFKELTAPPTVAAKENRMSAAGISMFYGALDKDTAVQEIRNYAPDSVIDLGEFELKNDQVVIDLFQIPEHLSFWMPKYFMEYKFLKNFHSEITKPVGVNLGIEYVPTQIFTEYIRFMNNCHIDGIVYRSSLTGRKNIVLFYDNETSDQVLQLNHAFTI